MKIAIIGYPATGKTTLAKKLATDWNLKVYHTDDYITSDYSGDMYRIYSELKKEDNFIVEGVQAYRILRKGAQNRDLFFDAVIICKSSAEARKKRYAEGRDVSKIENMDRVDKSLETVWNEYKNTVNLLGQTPQIIDYHS